jgi:3-hydroxyacyl-[acyl-carrier-protein] dehydratase
MTTRHTEEEHRGLSFDVVGIQKCQRNRHPMLFVDLVDNVVPGESARGIKCFTFNEWFFPMHYEDEPNVPGFIQVECLVQTFIMTFLCMPEYQGMKTNFVKISDFVFKRKIVPGDVLEITAKLEQFKRGVAKGSAAGSVRDELACRGDFVVAIPDILETFRPSTPTE